MGFGQAAPPPADLLAFQGLVDLDKDFKPGVLETRGSFMSSTT